MIISPIVIPNSSNTHRPNSTSSETNQGELSERTESAAKRSASVPIGTSPPLKGKVLPREVHGESEENSVSWEALALVLLVLAVANAYRASRI